MKLQAIIPAILLALFCALFASSAFAQADESGLDLRVGLGAQLLRVDSTVTRSGSVLGKDYKITSELKDPIAFNGAIGKIAIGYRWKYFGLYLDQDLGSAKWDGKTPGYKVSGNSDSLGLSGNAESQDEAIDQGEKNTYFLGGTYFTIRGIFPVTSSFQIDLGVGFGAIYADGDKASEANSENDKPALIANEDGDPCALFSLKFSLTLTYYFTKMFGLAVFLDYNLSFDNYDSTTKSYENTISTYKSESEKLYHLINPGLMAVLHF